MRGKFNFLNNVLLIIFRNLCNYAIRNPFFLETTIGRGADYDKTKAPLDWHTTKSKSKASVKTPTKDLHSGVTNLKSKYVLFFEQLIFALGTEHIYRAVFVQ